MLNWIFRFAQQLDETGQPDLADRMDQLVTQQEIVPPSIAPQSLLSKIEALKPQMAMAAQAIYDEWAQDESGMDEEFGSGGICDAISGAISSLVSLNIQDVDVAEGGQPGDDHTYPVFYSGSEVVAVDIPCHLYEYGQGYSWGKIHGISFIPDDIQVEKLNIDPNEFMDAYAGRTSKLRIAMRPFREDVDVVDQERWQKFLSRFPEGHTTAKNKNSSLPDNRFRCIFSQTMPNPSIVPEILSDLIPGLVAVGGCVRDAMMGIDPDDIDLATPMLPQDVMKVLSSYGIRVIPTGLKHGTVTAIVDNEPYEITTFRIDVDPDGRFTDVEFTDDLQQDLARRDFTINAMAMDQHGNVIDPFDGAKDLQNKIIRAVGNPQERFKEDLLRIIRAARFSSRFDFKVEPNTAKAMEDLAPELIAAIETGPISIERVVMEFNKAFKGDNPSRFLNIMWDLGVFQNLIPEMANADSLMQNPQWHPEGSVWNHILEVVDRADPEYRWHALFHDLGKCIEYQPAEGGWYDFHGHADAGASSIEAVARRLKLPAELIKSIETTTASHMVGTHTGKNEPTERQIRRLQQKVGPHLEALRAVLKADSGKRWVPTWDKLFQPIDDIQQIKPALMGRHLIERGMQPGPDFKPFLDRAFQHQLDTGEMDPNKLFDIAKDKDGHSTETR